MTVPPLMGASSDSLVSAVVPPMNRTVIILDWDDTLLASSWLASNDLRLDNPYAIESHHRQELQQLEVRARKFIELSLSLGSVVIVTNAETGWVELSCERFLPGLSSVLPKVRVVSARTKYESKFPNQPSQWKVNAFRDEVDRILVSGSGELSNVVSIGDSHHEREALHTVTSEMENTLVKSVKFVERPSMDVVKRELELIHGCMEYIAKHSGDLDLMLSQSLLFGNETSGDLDATDASASSSWDEMDGITAANGM
jgi:hypothetical protein